MHVLLILSKKARIYTLSRIILKLYQIFLDLTTSFDRFGIDDTDLQVFPHRILYRCCRPSLFPSVVNSNHPLGGIDHIAVAAYETPFEIAFRVNFDYIATPDQAVERLVGCFHTARMWDCRLQRNRVAIFQFYNDFRKHQVSAGGKTTDEVGIAVLDSYKNLPAKF